MHKEEAMGELRRLTVYLSAFPKERHVDLFLVYEFLRGRGFSENMCYQMITEANPLPPEVH